MAGNVLIINGIDDAVSPPFTQGYTDNLVEKHEAIGNAVTVVSDIPNDITVYDQVWDVRLGYVPEDTLTPDEIEQYLSYLQSGGGMFVMGELAQYASRNASVVDLITLAGGGDIDLQNVSSRALQRVHDRFNQPNALSDQDFYFADANIAGSPGTGFFITELIEGTGGSGIAWDAGTLTNALLGTLTVIFDVNFFQRHSDQPVNDPESELFVANLVRYIVDQIEQARGGSLSILSAQFDVTSVMIQQQLGLIAGAMGRMTTPLSGSMSGRLVGGVGGQGNGLALTEDEIAVTFQQNDLAAALAGDGGFNLDFDKATLFVNVSRSFG
ncbi:MAG: hypothetical protein ACPGMT_05050, partial [Candidatus Puniceispirillaceae bacterium]